ncbi:MAG: hypothetical protein GXX85_05070 [Ignavibacteria bacterium]|nr:hypothetical protein [Ignavibacteria bacterium]
MKKYIFNKLKEYSAISSCSGDEKLFGEFLEKDFLGENGELLTNEKIKTRTVLENGNLHYFFLEANPSAKFFFTVHIDRVKNYLNTIKDFNEDILTGQLDNMISIGILRYLFSKGLRFNILFTTKEEVFISWEQIKEIMFLNPKLIPVSLDIDIIKEIYLKDGKFSLRSKDVIGFYKTSLVAKLRKLASANNIEFIDERIGWTAVESGYLHRNTGLRGAHIGLPITEYHTDSEKCNWKTIENAARFIELLIENQDKVFRQKGKSINKKGG